MNQRKGSTHGTASSFSSSDQQARALVEFFKSAKEALAEYDHEDASFYFEQVEDHLRRGGSLNDDIGRILGV